MEVNNTMYGNNKDDPKKNWTICIQNHAYMMWHLRLCGMSSWQMKTIVSIGHQWIELRKLMLISGWKSSWKNQFMTALLCQCASLCMEQYTWTWTHAISSKMHAEWFFYPSDHLCHNLDRTTRLDKTTWLERTICLIDGIPLPTGPRLLFLQCYVSDHFLVFCWWIVWIVVGNLC